MIKRLLRHVQKRREIKLRKWCISQAAKAGCDGDDLSYIADSLYKWITEEV